jgi:hypothetical protein
MFLIFEGMDYEYVTLVGCRSIKEAALERARELAKALTTEADWIGVWEYPDGDFDLPRHPDNYKMRVMEYRKGSHHG